MQQVSGSWREESTERANISEPAGAERKIFIYSEMGK